MLEGSIVKDLDKESFEKEVIKSKIPVIVDFYADWCGPCKMMAPTFEKLSKDFEGKINFFKLNVDNNEEISSDYSVMSIPTLIIFKDGKEVDRMVGAQGEDQLKKKLQAI